LGNGELASQREPGQLHHWLTNAGQAVVSVLAQRFQLDSGADGTFTGGTNFLYWNPTANTLIWVHCGGDGECSDNSNPTNASNNVHNYGGSQTGVAGAGQIDQWVVGFVKDSDGNDGIVSSYSSWFMRENNFKECPVTFPGPTGTTGVSNFPNTQVSTNPFPQFSTGGNFQGTSCGVILNRDVGTTHQVNEIDNHPNGGLPAIIPGGQ